MTRTGDRYRARIHTVGRRAAMTCRATLAGLEGMPVSPHPPVSGVNWRRLEAAAPLLQGLTPKFSGLGSSTACVAKVSRC
jgi:hypothetical protein